MRTIKERARKYTEQAIICGGTSFFSSYIAGAAEQHAIDIEKACKWLKENARDHACATIRCPYGEEEEIICDVHREIVEDFRKAMEE